jgi:hypothetical protein
MDFGPKTLWRRGAAGCFSFFESFLAGLESATEIGERRLLGGELAG